MTLPCKRTSRAISSGSIASRTFGSLPRLDLAFVPEGSCLFQPPLVPHSPRYALDAFQLVIERTRAPGDIDRFYWFCTSCDNLLHEETYVVDDYSADPVTRAYRNFYDSEEFRTCKKCGTVMAAPASL